VTRGLKVRLTAKHRMFHDENITGPIEGSFVEDM
jgi:hypothetical protein